jgi:hypothetical protein
MKKSGKPEPKNYNYFELAQRGTGVLFIYLKQQIHYCLIYKFRVSPALAAFP